MEGGRERGEDGAGAGQLRSATGWAGRARPASAGAGGEEPGCLSETGGEVAWQGAAVVPPSPLWVAVQGNGWVEAVPSPAAPCAAPAFLRLAKKR